MSKKLLLFFYLVFLNGFAQNNKEIIQNYLNSPKAKNAISKDDFSEWSIQSDGGKTSSGIENCFVIQKYNGIEIFNAVSNFHIKNKEVIDVQKRLVTGISKKVNATSPKIDIIESLKQAYRILNLQQVSPITILENKERNHYKLSNGFNFEDPVQASLVYHQTNEEQLILAWNFTIHTPNHQNIWSVRMDASTGKMLEKNNMVLSCSFDKNNAYNVTEKKEKKIFDINYKQIYTPQTNSATSGTYRVLPFDIESPNHGAFKLISNAEDATASPFGWHDTNGVVGAEYTITRGNNVWAKEDFLGNNNINGTSPDGGQNLIFDFPYGGTSAVASTYIDAATTNLFYMTNIMHDVWYNYGFNEANGNFQENNYNKGGSAGDFVIAEAQDGSLAATPNLNNANFSTPIDGTPGRMQMFLWNRVPQIKPIIVNSPSSIAGQYVARQNSFNPGNVALPIAPNSITSDLVLYLDNGATTSEACVIPSNASALKDKIVIIRRGNCSFTTKTKFAQDAGALAVIIVNNAEGEITMSGADATLTIPSISVTQEVGEKLITELLFSKVNISLQLPSSSTFINTDGDFDNGIIAHEFGHGISTRLAGGRLNSNCLTNTDQMGEGWSDWFALMMQLKPGDVGTAKRGIGTFVSSQPTDGVGIRSYPYSTDKTVNPMTFVFTNNFQFQEDGVEKTSVHGVGSVWATILWDLTWAYINKYGFDNNKYTGQGGNNKIMTLVLDGIKLQPCNPTFVEARDAIIAADQAITGGKDFCMIWEVFANRGLGVNANSGQRNIGNDQTEDFTRPAAGPNCATLSSNDFDQLNIINVYPNPSKGTFNLTINQYNGNIDISVVDLLGRLIYKNDQQEFNNEKVIDLSSLKTGIYILKVTGKDLNYVTKLVID